MASATVGLVGWHAEYQRAESLASKVTSLEKQEARSAVMRSVSRQMEEIAIQQRVISDEQREVAFQEKRNADAMRQRSEVERRHALIAQQQAVASERRAQEARQVAESERLTAEWQRMQAELSKRVADTLTYRALGRSLGSLSSIQAQSGNTDLANLLAYASYEYTSRYSGDVYYPAVLRAVTQSSQSKRTWSMHSGMLTNIASLPGSSDRLVTISTFGEVMSHQIHDDGQLSSKVLVRNSDYDFRDVHVVSDGTVYALSRSGHLVICHIDGGRLRVIALPHMDHPLALSPLGGELVIVGEHAVSLFNLSTNSITAHRVLDYQVTFCSRSDNSPLLFDDKGNMHLLKTFDADISRPVPVSGTVTAFAESKNTGMSAYGMSDGVINLINGHEGKVTRLVGHQSRISRVRINGKRLYSASYDGTLRQWMTNGEKIDPVTLLELEQWLINFTFDGSKHNICVGDRDGNLSMTLMSVPTMVERIRRKLKRDFTEEEWTYYIGNKIPYESFYSQGGKEVAP